MLTVDRQQQSTDRDAKQLRLRVRRDALDGDPHATTHLVHRETERASAKDVVARHSATWANLSGESPVTLKTAEQALSVFRKIRAA
jgi:hypothetical protein